VGDLVIMMSSPGQNTEETLTYFGATRHHGCKFSIE